MEDEKILQIGVMMGNVHTPHPKEVLRGLYAGAENKRVNLTLFLGAQGDIYDYWKDSSADSQSDENAFTTYNYQYNALYDYAHMADFDALIIAFGTLSMYMDSKHRRDFLNKFKDIPLIVIQEYNEMATFNYIIADNYSGMYDTVSHLIEEHGYKKILYLSGPKMNTDSSERLHGYFDAMNVHGLTVEADMIEYGDFSQSVDYLVEKLLDAHPDADAIAVANDEMALCVYRVCKERGIMIGRDIAVVGFDDIELASRLVPPLTTTRQDGFSMGRMAMKLACQGVSNDENKLYRLPVTMVKRASCGCTYVEASTAQSLAPFIEGLHSDTDPKFIAKVARAMTKLSLSAIHEKNSLDMCQAYFVGTISLLIEIADSELTRDTMHAFSKRYNELMRRNLYFDDHNEVDWGVFVEAVHRLIDDAIATTDDIDKIRYYHKLTEYTHRYIESMLIRTDTATIDTLTKHCWDASLVIQSLKENVSDHDAFFRIAMQQTKLQGALSSYIYLLKEPVVFYRDQDFKLPTSLTLISKYENDEITVYPYGKGQKISRHHGYSSMYPNTQGHNYVTFLLFSESEQYGLLVCEISADQVAGMQAVSMQISSGLSFLQMTIRENAVKQELYDTLKTLREKNKILSSVSSNDPMTGAYNRRGFTERFLELCRENDQADAQLLFCDLDHLKEINDVFGHNEGDFAIKSLSDILTTAIGDKGCVGRIGGDEFIAMVVMDDSSALDLQFAIKNELTKLNNKSNKPYYVECSLGCQSFSCSEDAQLDELVHQADARMYLQKATRRTTIRRDSENKNTYVLS